MYILAIETTGPKGSVAIIDESNQVTMEVSAEEMNHLKDLMPMAQRLIDKLELKKSDMAAVAASVGPGSFTGIRIGVSTARAIAQALQIPAVAVPTLDAFKQKCDGVTMIVPIFNARRGQVYGGVFDEQGEDVLKSGPYMLTDVFEAIENCLRDRMDDAPCGMAPSGRIMFYGDGIDAYGQQLAEFKEKMIKDFGTFVMDEASKEERYQTAEMTAKVASALFAQGKTYQYDQLEPEYMRGTEAEQKLKDGSLQREREAKMARFKAK
ncbi:MAG: tRNA (adenosine(37)-N6)-threonylcarbamoyltransferase complex dimerization subunit type 1 TsaB [Firmicutes bacterium]|nr:tRNA (adenosine(37)-N6)-threonylcarbamoyltransferase complex dimerization subunit type 1 TsaB [Bacillota bacterium]